MMAGSPATESEPQPHPNTRPCADCEHVWFAGERQHVYVDVRDRRPGEDDEVICVLCKLVRERPQTDESW